MPSAPVIGNPQGSPPRTPPSTSTSRTTSPTSSPTNSSIASPNSPPPLNVHEYPPMVPTAVKSLPPFKANPDVPPPTWGRPCGEALPHKAPPPVLFRDAGHEKDMALAREQTQHLQASLQAMVAGGSALAPSHLLVPALASPPPPLNSAVPGISPLLGEPSKARPMHRHHPSPHQHQHPPLIVEGGSRSGQVPGDRLNPVPVDAMLWMMNTEPDPKARLLRPALPVPPLRPALFVPPLVIADVIDGSALAPSHLLDDPAFVDRGPALGLDSHGPLRPAETVALVKSASPPPKGGGTDAWAALLKGPWTPPYQKAVPPPPPRGMPNRFGILNVEKLKS